MGKAGRKVIVIQELQEVTRFVSYQECHNALGHPSVFPPWHELSRYPSMEPHLAPMSEFSPTPRPP